MAREEAEKEFEKLRMGKLRVGGGADDSDDDDDDYVDAKSDGAGSSSATAMAEKEETLDESISGEEAAACKERGNAQYKKGEYASAALEYARAASSAHATSSSRATYLANLAAAQLAQGEYEAVEKSATACLSIRAEYRKARERRLAAREALKRYRAAVEDARELQEPAARVAKLEKLAKETEEKQAAEAMDALKGLGNSLLSNFGLSLDSFSADKDPNTGSYSISMKR